MNLVEEYEEYVGRKMTLEERQLLEWLLEPVETDLCRICYQPLKYHKRLGDHFFEPLKMPRILWRLKVYEDREGIIRASLV